MFEFEGATPKQANNCQKTRINKTKSDTFISDFTHMYVRRAIFILYFQKKIELLSSAMEVMIMNSHILNMQKADLTVLDKLEIKPNFADLARKYKMDYRTVKKYYEGKPKNRKTKSKLDPYASII